MWVAEAHLDGVMLGWEDIQVGVGRGRHDVDKSVKKACKHPLLGLRCSGVILIFGREVSGRVWRVCMVQGNSF